MTAQDPSLECPECHRQLAGMLKRHIRQMNHISCFPENAYRPLRDSFDGPTGSGHCKTGENVARSLLTHALATAAMRAASTVSC